MTALPFEFVVREGPERGQRIPLPGERFTIGAGASCDVRFPANLVRELHAEVRRDDTGLFELEDRSGASLTWVDGKVTKKAPLVSGTIVRLGRLELMFVSLEDTASAEPTAYTGFRSEPAMQLGGGSSSGDGGLAALKATPLGRPLDAPVVDAFAASSAPSASGRFTTGDVIDGRYRITARIAAGGMGEVYKVEHVELGKALAMKVMLPGLTADQEFIHRFKIEAVAASRIGHPNIIDISDFGRTGDGRFYFVMEFLDGLTLSTLLHREGQQAPARAVGLTLQVARALAAAHELHIVHRDLKPDNVMVLQRPGNPDLVKVLDFGVARVKVDDESIGKTAAGIVVGTPQYMSPEQAKAIVVDARSDIYSLGLILHELLTGKPAFTGETPPIVMVKQVTEPPPPLPDWVNEDLSSLVFAMLEKDPSARPQEMKEVAQALDRLHRTLKTNDFQVPPSGPRPQERTPTPAPPRSGRRRAPTPARAPTPTRASTPERAAPLVVEPASGSTVVAKPTDSIPEFEAVAPSRAPMIVGGVALLALLGGGVVLFSDNAKVEPPVQVVKSVPLVPVDPPTPPAPTDVVVRIESVPPGAEVSENGVMLGNAPVSVKRRDGSTVEVTLSLAGFVTARRTLLLAADVPTLTVTLEPEKRAAPRPRPEPRPEVKPEAAPAKKPEPKPILKEVPF